MTALTTLLTPIHVILQLIANPFAHLFTQEVFMLGTGDKQKNQGAFSVMARPPRERYNLKLETHPKKLLPVM